MQNLNWMKKNLAPTKMIYVCMLPIRGERAQNAHGVWPMEIGNAECLLGVSAFLCSAVTVYTNSKELYPFHFRSQRIT